MNLKSLKGLYELYIKSRNTDEKALIIDKIVNCLKIIHQVKNLDIDKIHRYDNKISYIINNEFKNFYFIGNDYYINGLKISL